jgi:hypothetical protein
MFGPLNRRPDGTYVFATPIEKGHAPMIALSDIGWWARYVFDHRSETSGKDLKISSDWVSWDYLRETFEKVTGKKAVVVHQTIDEWMDNFNSVTDRVGRLENPFYGKLANDFTDPALCTRSPPYRSDRGCTYLA